MPVSVQKYRLHPLYMISLPRINWVTVC